MRVVSVKASAGDTSLVGSYFHAGERRSGRDCGQAGRSEGRARREGGRARPRAAARGAGGRRRALRPLVLRRHRARGPRRARSLRGGAGALAPPPATSPERAEAPRVHADTRGARLAVAVGSLDDDFVMFAEGLTPTPEERRVGPASRRSGQDRARTLGISPDVLHQPRDLPIDAAQLYTPRTHRPLRRIKAAYDSGELFPRQPPDRPCGGVGEERSVRRRRPRSAPP